MPANVKKTQLNRKDAKNAKIRKVKMGIEETAKISAYLKMSVLSLGVLLNRHVRLLRSGIKSRANNNYFVFPLRSSRLCGSIVFVFLFGCLHH